MVITILYYHNINCILYILVKLHKNIYICEMRPNVFLKSYLIIKMEEWFSRRCAWFAQSAAIVLVLRKWILDILLWFHTNAERRRQRWAYSEITFVPGGCSSFGLLLALQHRSFSSPSLNHLIRFYFLVDRPFFQINSFFPANPSFPSQVP